MICIAAGLHIRGVALTYLHELCVQVDVFS